MKTPGTSGGIHTLFILPNAIGDVLCGLGIADSFAREGPLTWIVNTSAAGLLTGESFRLLHPPAAQVRGMAAFGASTESLWDIAHRFLEDVRQAGPYDRIVNVHLSRAASLMAGTALNPQRTQTVFGPALGAQLRSDPWSDFFIGSLHHGVSPEIPAVARFSLVAGLPEETAPSRPHAPRPDGPIILVPGSGWPSKALGTEQAAALADSLGTLAPVVLLGGPAEQTWLNEIRKASRSAPDVQVPHHLADSLDLLRTASTIVTTDTWALHAAGALDRPVVALLGSTRVFPRGQALALSPRSLGSWSPQGDRSIEAIPAGVVLAAVQSLRNEIAVETQEWPDNLLLWNCRSRWPMPHRPMTGASGSALMAVFARARAEGFNAVLKNVRGDLPRAALRPAEDFPRWLDGSRQLARRAVESWSDREETFVLFPTTFPGEDPERIRSLWEKETRSALQRIAGA